MGHFRSTSPFAMLLVVSAIGCGGTSPTPGTDAGPGVDAFVSADDGGGGGMDPVDLRVVTGPDSTPIAGAAVAFDRPGGLRIEATTGADGIAHFDIDWANGPFDAVVWAEGYSARAILDIDRAVYDEFVFESAVPIHVNPIAAVSTVTVSGAITGAVDGSHYVYVYNTASDTTWSGRSGSYELEVPSGVPFQLIALEVDYVAGTDRDFTQAIVASVRTPEQPASTADVTLDVDLTTNAFTMTEVSGSFDVPSSLRAFADAATLLASVVPTRPPSFLMGVATSARWAADGSSVDYELAYAMPPSVSSVRSVYGVGNGERRALAFVDGAPVAGAQAFELLPVPEVRELMPGSFPHLFETVVITNALAEAHSAVVITSGGLLRYEVDAPLGEDHVVIPMLPSAADAATFFAGSLGRQVSFCILSDSRELPFCERYSTSYRVPVDP